MEWFNKLDFLEQIQVNQDFINRDQKFRSYDRVKFVKNWIKSKSTQVKVARFLEQKEASFCLKLRICKSYLNLFIEFGGLLHEEVKFSHDSQLKLVQLIQNWLKSEILKNQMMYF